MAHVTALTACRERFPFSTRLVVSIYCLIGISTRVLAVVMYFSVPLGLFNLLRHLQAEQIPWNPYLVYGFVGSNATGFISFGNQSINWSLLDR